MSMSLSPYIGSVLGVRVQLHWSFVLLLAFAFIAAVAFNLLYLFILIVLLFVCVFVHELFHSVTAMRNRVRIKRIVLLPLGGASVMDDSRGISPSTEFRIAIVGPLASILLGALFGIAVIFSPPGIVNQLMQFLFEINLLLGIFNLLPGFPLDGGRVLRSYLQGKRDYMDATRIAVRVSNVFVVLFVVATVAYAAIIPNYQFADREFIVLWDVIIALFLYDGARAELQGAYVRHYSRGLRAGDVMSRSYLMVSAGMPLERLYPRLVKSGSRIVIARSGKSLMAVRRVPNALKGSGLKVRDICEPLRTVDRRAPLYSAVSEMASHNTPIIGVTSRGRLAGLLLAQHVEHVISLKAHADMRKKGPRPAKA